MVTDTNMTDTHSESEPEGELDPQDVFVDVGPQNCREKDAGYLPLYELPKETKNERHGCCTRSCLNNWFQ